MNIDTTITQNNHNNNSFAETATHRSPGVEITPIENSHANICKEDSVSNTMNTNTSALLSNKYSHHINRREATRPPTGQHNDLEQQYSSDSTQHCGENMRIQSSDTSPSQTVTVSKTVQQDNDYSARQLSPKAQKLLHNKQPIATTITEQTAQSLCQFINHQIENPTINERNTHNSQPSQSTISNNQDSMQTDALTAHRQGYVPYTNPQGIERLPMPEDDNACACMVTYYNRKQLQNGMHSTRIRVSIVDERDCDKQSAFKLTQAAAHIAHLAMEVTRHRLPSRMLNTLVDNTNKYRVQFLAFLLQKYKHNERVRRDMLFSNYPMCINSIHTIVVNDHYCENMIYASIGHQIYWITVTLRLQGSRWICTTLELGRPMCHNDKHELDKKAKNKDPHAKEGRLFSYGELKYIADDSNRKLHIEALKKILKEGNTDSVAGDDKNSSESILQHSNDEPHDDLSILEQHFTQYGVSVQMKSTTHSDDGENAKEKSQSSTNMNNSENIKSNQRVSDNTKK